jgi:esterase
VNRGKNVLSHTRVTAGPDEPGSWVYLIHGIYGSGRNWGSLARRLVQERPALGAILVDLRLHGGSADMAPPHTLRACADDVARLEESLGLPAMAILGHSFGGKVALVRGAEEGEELRQIWVMDSTLRTGEPTGSAWAIIDIVRNLPETFASRDEVADALVEHGYARGVGQWLAMNLVREKDGFRWKLDWDGVEEMLRDYFATDVWQVIDAPPRGVEVHVVKAAESEAIDRESAARIHAAGETTGRVHLHTVAGGHWINVDNPDGVLELLIATL